MYEIFKELTFEAAHSLPHLPDSHKCYHVHGHSYKVRVAVRGPIDPQTHFVVDYADIKDAWEPLYDRLDHKFLNEVYGLEISTSEALSQWIFDRLKASLPGLYSVTVNETATAGCTYQED
jgi:6-pyruvoyltetrahydropterin/6-carboxytetrahydropterin synthase